MTSGSISSVMDFESIFRKLPGLYLILSPDLTIIEVNEAYNKATMTRRDEIIGRHLFEVFPDNPDDKDADGVANLRTSLNFVISHQMEHAMAMQKYDIARTDGSFEVRYWSPINIPVCRDDGSLYCIIHRVEDVTEFVLTEQSQQEINLQNQGLKREIQEMQVDLVKRARDIQNLNADLENKVQTRTEELRQHQRILQLRNDQLEQQNKELELFTYITSHDLQEPLRTMKSFVGLLMEDFADILNDDGKIYLNYINESSSRMQELIRGLMEHSRIGHGTKAEFVDCNELLKIVTDDLKSLIEQHHATITVHQLPYLLVFRTEFRLLFQNLLSNGIKFHKPGSRPLVEVAATELENAYQFSISDNGIGIREEDFNRLFQIFKRLNNRSDFEGTGIGLAHCKKIVQLHEGSIWVESSPGNGSTFKFNLPKHPKYAK